jgi:hypothetical protein
MVHFVIAIDVCDSLFLSACARSSLPHPVTQPHAKLADIHVHDLAVLIVHRCARASLVRLLSTEVSYDHQAIPHYYHCDACGHIIACRFPLNTIFASSPRMQSQSTPDGHFSPPDHDHCRRSKPLSRVTPSKTWPGSMLLPVSENDSSDMKSTIATLLSTRLACECPRDCLSNADFDSAWENSPA